MSEIDAKTFKPTKEEEAILDACFRGNIQCLGAAIVNYGRALFAPAASETAKVETADEIHIRYHGVGCKCEWRPFTACQPAASEPAVARQTTTDPSEPPESDTRTMGGGINTQPEPAAPVKRYKCRACGAISSGEPDCCNYGTQNPEELPAAPKMPEAVRLASLALHRAAGFYACEAQPTASIMRIVEAADALESWWRNVAPKKTEKVPVREIGRAASALRLWKTQTDTDVFGAKEDADEIDRWLKRLDAFERGSAGAWA